MQETQLQKIIRKRKEYHKKRKKMSSQNIEQFGMEYLPQTRKAPEVFEMLLEINDEYCSHFGCGRKLKLHEKLAGKKCINHMIKTNKLIHTGLI